MLNLKEFIERRAGVFSIHGRSGGLALDGFSGLKQLTLISNILLRNSFGDGFTALKPRSRVEAHTVFTHVQVVMTFGAL